MIILLTVLFYIAFLVKQTFFWTVPSGMVQVIGVPGSGKTTLAAAFVQKQYKSDLKYNKKHPDSPKRIYSNVPIINSYKLEPKKDLGVYDSVNGTILIDEANLEFSNRDWKNLEKKVIKFTKLFRHYGIDSFIMFSQALDQDKTFRDLSHRVCILEKSILPNVTVVRDLTRKIKPHETEGDIRDFYAYKGFFLGGVHLLRRKPYYKFFDSFEAPPLEVKDWESWSATSRYE